MKVVCKSKRQLGTHDGYYINLTLDKIYITLSDFYDRDLMVKLVDDEGEECWYPKKNFQSMEYLREKKLSELGI